MRLSRAVCAAAFLLLHGTLTMADEPWIITEPVTLTTPQSLGDVIVWDGGELVISGVGEPGVEIAGNLWVAATGRARLDSSVVHIPSTYHAQYSLVAADSAEVVISGCDYRVTPGIQHALWSAGAASVIIEDTDFGEVQLAASQDARLEARRLQGHFEVILQDSATMVLEDIPRLPDGGDLWVWVEVPPGSTVRYSPPMPGRLEAWSFPPPDALGITQRVDVRRCQVLLWPLLVRERSDLVLHDIAEDNWVVVGLHLFDDATVVGLRNQTTYADSTLELDDRSLRLERASIDTWNLYPQANARVTVRESHVGEILAMGGSHVRVEQTTIDGTGGFLGATDTATMVLADSTITCTIQAIRDSRLELHRCQALPYPVDPTGDFTRFGAYDNARLLAAQTPILSTPALGGEGVIGIVYLEQLPAAPPGPGEVFDLRGTVGLFGLDQAPVPGRWTLEAVDRRGRAELLASGQVVVEDAPIATWSDADSANDYGLRAVMTDTRGRRLVWQHHVRGTGDRVRAPTGVVERP